MKQARMILDRDYVIGQVDPRIYGSFVEHLGRGFKVELSGPPPRGLRAFARQRVRGPEQGIHAPYKGG